MHIKCLPVCRSVCNACLSVKSIFLIPNSCRPIRLISSTVFTNGKRLQKVSFALPYSTQSMARARPVSPVSGRDFVYPQRVKFSFPVHSFEARLSSVTTGGKTMLLFSRKFNDRFVRIIWLTFYLPRYDTMSQNLLRNQSC